MILTKSNNCHVDVLMVDEVLDEQLSVRVKHVKGFQMDQEFLHFNNWS